MINRIGHKIRIYTNGFFQDKKNLYIICLSYIAFWWTTKSLMDGGQATWCTLLVLVLHIPRCCFQDRVVSIFELLRLPGFSYSCIQFCNLYNIMLVETLFGYIWALYIFQFFFLSNLISSDKFSSILSMVLPLRPGIFFVGFIFLCR